MSYPCERILWLTGNKIRLYQTGLGNCWTEQLANLERSSR